MSLSYGGDDLARYDEPEDPFDDFDDLDDSEYCRICGVYLCGDVGDADGRSFPDSDICAECAEDFEP